MTPDLVGERLEAPVRLARELQASVEFFDELTRHAS